MKKFSLFFLTLFFLIVGVNASINGTILENTINLNNINLTESQEIISLTFQTNEVGSCTYDLNSNGIVAMDNTNNLSHSTSINLGVFGGSTENYTLNLACDFEEILYIGDIQFLAGDVTWGNITDINPNLKTDATTYFNDDSWLSAHSYAQGGTDHLRKWVCENTFGETYSINSWTGEFNSHRTLIAYRSNSFNQTYSSYDTGSLNNFLTITDLHCAEPDIVNITTSNKIASFLRVEDIILGCMDIGANNYNPLANSDDGTCTYTILGCTDIGANNYNPLANSDDGTCTYTILGCMDIGANNYNPLANSDDGTCTYTILGCMDIGATNYDSNANSDDGSCVYPVVAGNQFDNIGDTSSTFFGAIGTFFSLLVAFMLNNWIMFFILILLLGFSLAIIYALKDKVEGLLK